MRHDLTSTAVEGNKDGGDGKHTAIRAITPDGDIGDLAFEVGEDSTVAEPTGE